MTQDIVLKISGVEVDAPGAVKNVASKSGEYGAGLIQFGIGIFLGIIVIASIFFLLWGGIQWIISEGDKQKVAAARARITYAIIGLIVSLLSFFIISIIGKFFNIPI